MLYLFDNCTIYLTKHFNFDQKKLIQVANATATIVQHILWIFKQEFWAFLLNQTPLIHNRPKKKVWGHVGQAASVTNHKVRMDVMDGRKGRLESFPSS